MSTHKIFDYVVILFCIGLFIVASIFLCAVSAFLIRMVPATERNIVILSSFFNGIATFGWNALDIISTSDIFPVHLR